LENILQSNKGNRWAECFFGWVMCQDKVYCFDLLYFYCDLFQDQWGPDLQDQGYSNQYY